VRLLPLAFAVLVLGACGGYGDDDSDDEAAAPSGPAKTVQMSLVDYRLDPSTVRLDQSGTYSFQLTNDGGNDHALEIEGGGLEEESDLVNPGQIGELRVELEDGEYEMYCPIGNHRERGMVGTLVVGGGAMATTTDGDTPTTSETETETGETETESETETDG
jgi:plastocyanin